MKELPTMSRWNKIAERNRETVAKNAERVLADTAYDRFRSPRALVALVVAYVATTVVMTVCWLAWGTIAGVAAFAPWLAAFLLLRVAVRSQADLPDEVLDERMRAERDSVYVDAFRLVASVVFIAANVALAAVAFGDEHTSMTFDYHDVSAVYWALFSLLLGAPSLVLAMRKRSTGTV
jgi:hypothetical protein